MKKNRDLAETANGEQPPLNPLASAIDEAEQHRTTREIRDDKIANADRDAIDKIILSEDFGKGGKIRIKRKGPLDQTYQFVTYIKADDWDSEDSIEYIKKMFGGGDYQCQTFRASGAMYKPFTFSIDYRFKGQLDDQQIKALADESGKSADQTSKVLELLGRQREEGMRPADIMALMEKSSGNQMQMMTLMMTMMMKSMESSTQTMVAMVTAMGANRPPSNENLLLELIKQKRESSPMNETLEMMAKVKEIFEPQQKEEKEPEDMLSRISKIAMPLLSGMVGSGQPAPAPAPAQVSAPLPAPTAPQGESVPPPKLGGIYATLPFQQRMFFDMILNAAQRGLPVESYAELVIDQTDTSTWPQFKQTLTPSDWCAKLFGDENAVASIRPWLEQLKSLVIQYGTESFESPESAGAPTGPTGPGAA